MMKYFRRNFSMLTGFMGVYVLCYMYLCSEAALMRVLMHVIVNVLYTRCFMCISHLSRSIL